MEILPIAYYRSSLEGKFGLPRQSGLVPALHGKIVLQPEYAREEALRGLEGFSHIWLIWGFSLNRGGEGKLTVRPPRLGGNSRMGVFATRSPFRPNPIGLSCVRLEAIRDGVLEVSGADLADGTPVFDIKPYLPYADRIDGATGGFASAEEARELLTVEFAPGVAEAFGKDELEALAELLSQDPRPAFQDSPEREYALTYCGRNVRFRVDGRRLTVISA